MRLINRIRQRISKRFYRIPLVARISAAQFHRSYYYSIEKTWGNTSWLGVPLLKCSRDLWVYQEIPYDLQVRRGPERELLAFVANPP